MLNSRIVSFLITYSSLFVLNICVDAANDAICAVAIYAKLFEMNQGLPLPHSVRSDYWTFDVKNGFALNSRGATWAPQKSPWYVEPPPNPAKEKKIGEKARFKPKSGPSLGTVTNLASPH